MAIDREKLMLGLEHCGTRRRCNEECPYWVADCATKIAGDALAALREDADEIDDLRNRVYNLSIYLEEIFELMPGSKSAMEVRHPGLPGYVEVGRG